MTTQNEIRKIWQHYERCVNRGTAYRKYTEQNIDFLFQNHPT